MLARLTRHATRLLDAADLILASARVAGAVDRGVRPAALDLQRLGFAPHAFADRFANRA